jgi:tRNA (guanine37-N1)-methyltransferase
MKFNIITIFPEIFESYFGESIIKRAQEKGLIKIKIHNLRDFTDDRHKTVDGRPYSGGPGMIFKTEPIYKAVSFIKRTLQPFNRVRGRQAQGKGKTSLRLVGRGPKSKVILFSAKGKKFNQAMAKKLSKFNELTFICGRYEGVDERIAKHVADFELSVGDYVLTGGEIPAMTLVDAISRLIPGVIKEESLKKESFSLSKTKKGSILSEAELEYPQYTRPEIFSPKKGVSWRVPKVLLSGNHKKIEEWQKKHSKKR